MTDNPGTAYPEPFWSPDSTTAADSRIADFSRWLAQHRGIKAADYTDLHRWSVTDLTGFWSAVWEYFDVRAASPYQQVLAEEVMPGARWFTGATLNYAEHLLQALPSDHPAIIAMDETGSSHEISGDLLRAQVASVAATLRELGVGRGDRVVGYLPNTPHAVIAFLASASLGAIWSVCGQDYAAQAAADRFGQLEPVVLFAADGYRFNGRDHDCGAAVQELRRALPTLKATVLIDHIGVPLPAGEHGLSIGWADASGRDEPLTFEMVPFDHPLWVLFSSGTMQYVVRHRAL